MAERKDGSMKRIDLRTHFQDKVFTCCDCGNTFTFTAGEQVYFESKQLSPPKRCKPCRELRKQTLIPDPEARNG